MMNEEQIRSVLLGLMHCSKEQEGKEGCTGCPYQDDDSCIDNLCRDAYRVIVNQDKLIDQMYAGKGRVKAHDH